MALVQAAASVAAVLLGVAALFQVALALGAPLGEATMGGRAATVDGVLTPRFRIVAAFSALVLGLGAWIVLARADVVGSGVLGDDVPVWGAWVVVAFAALNTLSNLSGRHPLERWGMGSLTLIVAILTAFVAVSA